MNQNNQKILLTCLSLTVVICLCLSVVGIGAAGYLLWADSASPASVPQTLLTASPQESTPTPDAAGTPIPEGSLPAEITSQMDEIESQVQEIRGLKASQPIERQLFTSTALQRHVTENFLADYTPEEAHDDVLSLSAFGLLPPDFELLPFMQNLYSEQVAGFYDDEVKAMYVVQDAGFRGPQRMTYAHEFVHALQDQNFGLGAALGISDEQCQADSEHCAAVQALVEGDASLVEETWLHTFATDQDFTDLFDFYGHFHSPIYDSAPLFLQSDFLFPYQQGKDFVQHLYDSGGWEAVNVAYTTLPQSTEQIMHPERYPNDAPQTVNLPDLLPLLPADWREVDHGTLGEWYTYLMLSQGWQNVARLPDDIGLDAAAGWGGDAYTVFYAPDERRFVLAMDIRWDTEADASTFRRALLRYVSRRFNASTQNPADGLWVWETDSLASALHQDGARTVWVIAPDLTLADTLWEALKTP
ncbi:MAG: hypothetical protein Fur0018_04670 [Anaerolineales bacterium]